MEDRFGRNITYLRLSVTELCNLRCRYCMPADGICKKPHSAMLTEDEMIDAVSAAAALGVTKLRITGGEPLVKRNILSVCRRAAAVEGIREVCLTTNATLLAPMADELRAAGVRRINISLDTLDADKYRAVTRTGALGDALDGIDAALNAGFDKVKINTVLIGGFNDDEIPELAALTQRYPIDIRFIELMPMVDGIFDESAYLPCDAVLQALPEAVPETAPAGGVARLYRLPGAQGAIGLIRPVSAHFCGECNRIRITADGQVKPCLHCAAEYSLKGLRRDEMQAVLRTAIENKPAQHPPLSAQAHSEAGRNMNQIGG